MRTTWSRHRDQSVRGCRGPERTDWALACPTWAWPASVTSTQCWFSQGPSASAQRDLKQEPGSTGMLSPICAPEMPVLPLLFGLG